MGTHIFALFHSFFFLPLILQNINENKLKKIQLIHPLKSLDLDPLQTFQYFFEQILKQVFDREDQNDQILRDLHEQEIQVLQDDSLKLQQQYLPSQQDFCHCKC